MDIVEEPLAIIHMTGYQPTLDNAQVTNVRADVTCFACNLMLEARDKLRPGWDSQP